jgi:hypothetical protein
MNKKEREKIFSDISGPDFYLRNSQLRIIFAPHRNTFMEAGGYRSDGQELL